jgi:iron complex outermembrane recepter protein
VSGSDGYRRIQSSTSGRAGEVGYLLNLASLNYDGFRTNPVAGASGFYGSAERLNLNARADRAVAGGRLLLTVNAVDLDSENPGSLPATALEDPTRPAWAGNVNQGTGKTVKQSQAGVTWTGPVGGVQGEFTTFGIQREVSNPIPGQVIDLDRKAVGGRALFRWDRPAGEAGTRLWVAGAEVEGQFDDRSNFRNQAGERGALTLAQEERVISTGVFLQTVVPFSPTFWAMGGVRFDRIHFRADDNFVRPDGSDFSGERDVQALSPSLGLHWAASAATNLYLNVSTSFESPTTTELANRPDGSGGFNPDLESQRGIGGEMGLRTTLGPLDLELVGFLTAVSNELVPFEDEAQPGRVFFRNAGSSLYNGAELVLASPALNPLAGRITWSWTEARFREYVVGVQDFSDNAVPGQAPHRVEGIVTARPGRGVRAELRGEWVDAIPVNDANTATSDAYTVVDLRLGSDPFRWNGWRVTPTAGITNLLDQRYVSSIAVNAFGGRFFEPGPGRSLHLGVTVGVERSR